MTIEAHDMDITTNTSQVEMAAVHERINRLLAATAAVLLMLTLKRHYSLACAEDLFWILAPTARLTAWAGGLQPVWEAGVGYIDFGRGIVIAPACAGVNFMIMAFGLAAFCGLGRLRRLAGLLAWLVFSFAAAYLTALGVNTLRIVLSTALYRADIYSAGLTPDALHRVAGVWIYLSALGLFFKGLQPIMNRFADRFDPGGHSFRAIRSPWLPLGWYLLGAVGVPAVNLIFKAPPSVFGIHCLTVAAAAMILWGGGLLVKVLIARTIATGIR
jgi:exosortase K